MTSAEQPGAGVNGDLAGRVSAEHADPAEMMAAVIRDLGVLAQYGRLGGIAAITRTRARRLTGRLDAGYPPGGLVTEAAAELAGPHPDPQAYATAGALLACEIDRLNADSPEPGTEVIPPW